jgi:hypothetical protein
MRGLHTGYFILQLLVVIIVEGFAFSNFTMHYGILSLWLANDHPQPYSSIAGHCFGKN